MHELLNRFLDAIQRATREIHFMRPLPLQAASLFLALAIIWRDIR